MCSSESSTRPIEIRRLRPSDGLEVARFFAEDCHESFFRPHPMTKEHADVVCSYDVIQPGLRDVYLGGFSASTLVAYGFLRGWNEGYEIPSLGIIVASSARHQGVGRRMMAALHDIARLSRSRKIRLRVSPQNHAALSLYRSIGYVFNGEVDRGELVGTFIL